MEKMNTNALVMDTQVAPSISDIDDITFLVTKYRGFQAERAAEDLHTIAQSLQQAIAAV